MQLSFVQDRKVQTSNESWKTLGFTFIFALPYFRSNQWRHECFIDTKSWIPLDKTSILILKSYFGVCDTKPNVVIWVNAASYTFHLLDIHQKHSGSFLFGHSIILFFLVLLKSFHYTAVDFFFLSEQLLWSFQSVYGQTLPCCLQNWRRVSEVFVVGLFSLNDCESTLQHWSFSSFDIQKVTAPLMDVEVIAISPEMHHNKSHLGYIHDVMFT